MEYINFSSYTKFSNSFSSSSTVFVKFYGFKLSYDRGGKSRYRKNLIQKLPPPPQMSKIAIPRIKTILAVAITILNV